MIEHQTIEMFTKDWYRYTAICFAVISFVLMLGKRLDTKGKRYLRILLGISTFTSVILIHPYLVYIDQWTARNSLPLHMCELSEMFAAITLIWPNQWLFEILCYWGISGGVHSILTPEMLHKGNDTLLLFHYYFEHTVIILSPLLLMIVFDMRLSVRSWLKVFAFSNLCIPFIGALNWMIGSNYMYLAEKPKADNPFLIGSWPWYILVLEFVALTHYYVIYLLCTKRIKISIPGLKAKITNA